MIIGIADETHELQLLDQSAVEPLLCEDETILTHQGHVAAWFVTRTDSRSPSNGVALCDLHLVRWLHDEYPRDQAALAL